MLIKINKNGRDLACEPDELPSFLAAGWAETPLEEVEAPVEEVDPDLRLVAMTKDGDIRLCEIAQIKWMESLGWKPVEGTGHDEGNGSGLTAEGQGGPAEERGPSGGRAGRDSGTDGSVDGNDSEPSDGNEEDLTPEEAKIVKLREALLALDPKDDNVWTGLGLPRVNNLERVTGFKEITKAEIEQAVPGFKRPE